MIMKTIYNSDAHEQYLKLWDLVNLGSKPENIHRYQHHDSTKKIIYQI